MYVNEVCRAQTRPVVSAHQNSSHSHSVMHAYTFGGTGDSVEK